MLDHSGEAHATADRLADRNVRSGGVRLVREKVADVLFENLNEGDSNGDLCSVCTER